MTGTSALEFDGDSATISLGTAYFQQRMHFRSVGAVTLISICGAWVVVDVEGTLVDDVLVIGVVARSDHLGVLGSGDEVLGSVVEVRVTLDTTKRSARSGASW